MAPRLIPSLPAGESLPFSLRFRVGPFPVVVEPTFWLVALVLAGFQWLAPAWAAVLFVSVLVHELGHAMAARRYGSWASIRLYGLGGLTTHQQLPDRRHRIFVAVAGPLAGFALGLLVLAVDLLLPGDRPMAVAFTLRALLFTNFLWGVVNLLPIPPLDGGHVFEEAVGPRRKLLAAQVGTVVGAMAMVEAIRRWGPLSGLMFGYLSLRCGMTWLRIAGERRIQRQLKQAREKLWEDALANDEVGEPHRAALRETMLHLRQPPAAPAPEPEAERDHALLARIFGELGSASRAADHALEAHRKEPSDGNALQAVQLLLEAGRRAEAEALVSTARWSTEIARAEASALLSRAPARSRG